MSKNRYYLVSRDRETNVVKPIAISSNDIISDGNMISSNENDLCDIDLFTSKFTSKGALVLSLYHSGIIDNYDSDIYIISRNGDNINILDCIYGNDYFSSEIRKIALKKRVREFDNDSINFIFKDFSMRMYNDDNFYSFVISGYSNIYQKFIDYFKECRNLSDMYNCRLRDGAWAFGSYHLIRNIVDAYSKYSKYRYGFRGVHYEMNERKNVNNDISSFTNKDYVDGQVSLFDMTEDTTKEDYILSKLDILNPQAFITSNNGVHFNTKFFAVYEDNLYATELSRLLDSDILTLLLNYSLSKTSQSDLKSIKSRQDNISSLLMKKIKSDSTLCDRIYSFLLLYNKCMKDNGMNSGEYGRVYCKK